MPLQGVRTIGESTRRADVVAGVTLAALAIPEVMGYARSAAMPVVTGMLTLLLPTAAFALLGSSRHLVVGADSATAAILASGLSGLAIAGSPQYVALASGVAVLTGIVLLVARVVRLGFLADFLSRSVLVGFLCGVGVQVALGQVPDMLGVDVGRGATLPSIWRLVVRLDEVSGPQALVAAAVLLTVLAIRAVNRKLPGALIAVIGSIVVSWLFDLRAHGVPVLGALPTGLPRPALPHIAIAEMTRLVGTVAVIALVIVGQSAATSRAYAARHREVFSEDDDLVGLGVANLAAGFAGSFVVNGSPTKTEIVDDAGGRSQVAQLAMAATVLVVLLVATRPLAVLPNPTLAAIVFLIGVGLVDLGELRRIARVRRDEFLIAVVTGLAVISIGVGPGVVLAIVLSLLDYVRRGYRPSRALLVADERGHVHARPLDSGAHAIPGFAVYRFSADVFYANANILANDLRSLESDPSVHWICIDAAAINDVDYSGWRTLDEARSSMLDRGARLVLADVAHDVRAQLERYGFVATLGDDALFPTIGEAADAYRAAVGIDPD